MTSSDLIRLGGLAAMLGGVLFVAYAVLTWLFSPFFDEAHWAYHMVNAPPNALLAVGIVGLYLYLRQAENFGVIGKVGFFLCVVVFALTAIGGVGIIVAETLFEGTLVSVLDIIHPMVVLLVIGSILFGIGIVRAGRLSRGGALLLIVVPVLLLATLFGGIETAWIISGLLVLFGAGWAWLGYSLWSESATLPQQPSRVR